MTLILTFGPIGELFNQQWFLFRDYYPYLAREIIITPEFRTEKGVVYPGYREAKAILDRQGIDEILIIKQIKEVLFFFHEPQVKFWRSRPGESDALFVTEIERAAKEIDERVEAYCREAFDHPERLSDHLVSLCQPQPTRERFPMRHTAGRWVCEPLPGWGFRPGWPGRGRGNQRLLDHSGMSKARRSPERGGSAGRGWINSCRS